MRLLREPSYYQQRFDAAVALEPTSRSGALRIYRDVACELDAYFSAELTRAERSGKWWGVIVGLLCPGIQLVTVPLGWWIGRSIATSATLGTLKALPQWPLYMAALVAYGRLEIHEQRKS